MESADTLQRRDGADKKNAENQMDQPYFNYYAMLQHQQNMLQDTVRTNTYRQAILENSNSSFKDKLVMDVGAGSGILSYFSVQAGAKKVYAVEASKMAAKMQKLLDASITQGKNPFLRDKIEILNSKAEDIRPDSIPKVDTIVSEPIGVFLVHERMLETYLYARDNFLKPGGTLLPSKGTMVLAPFTDAILYSETMMKARFWENQSFYGIDLSPLFPDARDEMFGQPVVGHFDPNSLLYTPNPNTAYEVDFHTISNDALKDITIPIDWDVNYTGLIHGIAGWFDLFFAAGQDKSSAQVVQMSTSPSSDRTHWQQVRFLFKEPLAINAGQRLQGWMRAVVNHVRSYYVTIEITTGPDTLLTSPSEAFKFKDPSLAEPVYSSRTHPLVRRSTWNLQEQTYNYSYNPPAPANNDFDLSNTNQNVFRPEYSCMYRPEGAQELPAPMYLFNAYEDFSYQ